MWTTMNVFTVYDTTTIYNIKRVLYSDWVENIFMFGCLSTITHFNIFHCLDLICEEKKRLYQYSVTMYLKTIIHQLIWILKINFSNKITLSIVFKYHIYQTRICIHYILYTMWRLKFQVIRCLVVFKFPFNNSVLYIQ